MPPRPLTCDIGGLTLPTLPIPIPRQPLCEPPPHPRPRCTAAATQPRPLSLAPLPALLPPRLSAATPAPATSASLPARARWSSQVQSSRRLPSGGAPRPPADASTAGLQRLPAPQRWSKGCTWQHVPTSRSHTLASHPAFSYPSKPPHAVHASPTSLEGKPCNASLHTRLPVSLLPYAVLIALCTPCWCSMHRDAACFLTQHSQPSTQPCAYHSPHPGRPATLNTHPHLILFPTHLEPLQHLILPPPPLPPSLPRT